MVIVRHPIRELQGNTMFRMLILLCCLSAPLFASQATHGADAAKPNVLFLFTDDQRADTIAALGNPHINTPNLDELARAGFVFNNAYCMGSTMPAVCNPSRHMMHSGMSLFRYDPKQIEGTFGETMKRAGYYTYHESKRGNTPHTYHTAFDHSSYLNDMAERTSGHHGRTAANHAIKFLKDYDEDKPFFMYIGFAGPHDPRVAAEQWKSLYDPAKLPLPGNYKPFHPFDNGEMVIRDEQLAPWPGAISVSVAVRSAWIKRSICWVTSAGWRALKLLAGTSAAVAANSPAASPKTATPCANKRVECFIGRSSTACW